jgi:hypothetical protein
MIEFTPIWFQFEIPRRSYDARGKTLTGSITIDSQSVEVRSKDKVIRLDRIDRISYGRRGSDFVNKWIEVEYEAGGLRVVAYLKDAGWRGWRPLLTRSNRPILTALRAHCSPNL